VSLDSPVLVVFSTTTNFAWYSSGFINWHINLKQALVCAQYKLVIYGDSNLVLLFCFIPSSVVSDAVYMKIIVVLLTEYHSVIAKK
jgi:hypothetical protein